MINRSGEWPEAPLGRNRARSLEPRAGRHQRVRDFGPPPVRGLNRLLAHPNFQNFGHMREDFFHLALLDRAIGRAFLWRGKVGRLDKSERKYRITKWIEKNVAGST